MKFYVLKIESRFFYGFGKKQRLKTAWCLAGAFIFMGRTDDGLLKNIEQKLVSKKIKFVRCEVGII